MKKPAIEVQNLEFGYEKKPILSGISLTVDPGEYIAIFGPNGGGKTTFLKLLMGFINPRHGKILLFGETPQQFRTSIGYVPQTNQYDKKFPISVLELVLTGCMPSPWGRYSKDQIEKARQALKKVALEHKEEAHFGTLSGGQAQRALIARAIVGNPQILFLDEPTANVDPEAENEIQELLNSFKREITILMVTHHLNPVIHRVDRLLCVDRKISSFKPGQVCEHFALGLYHPPLITEDR